MSSKLPTNQRKPTKTLTKTSAPKPALSARKSPSVTSAKGPSKRFTTNGSPSVRSFVTSGLRVRNRNSHLNDFSYDLSSDEIRSMGSFKSPMKTVPDSERELLKTGQRTEYLNQRYEHSPDCKYNYPEATSWRIGWLHNQNS